MEREPKLLRSDERPPFVARAFDVVRFRAPRRQRAVWIVILCMSVVSAGIVATSPLGPLWRQAVVFPGLAIGLVFSVHCSTLRLEVTTTGVRQASLLSATTVPWSDVCSIQTWTDIPLNERTQLEGWGLVVFWIWTIAAGVVIATIARSHYGHLGMFVGLSAALGWTFLGLWTDFRLRRRDVATLRLTRNGDRVTTFRFQMDGRDFVSLKRHVRRCALEHGIDPPL